jgi:DNA-binding NtrC family response regulator
VIVSRRTHDMSPLELVAALRAVDSRHPILAVTDSGEDAVAALRAGAYYAVRSPIHPEEITVLMRRALEQTSALRRTPATPSDVEARVESLLVGESPAMRAIKDTVRRLGASPTTTVLVTGESGAGKDAVARAIHAATVDDGPFIYLTPSALREPLLEVELFGIEPGPSNGQARTGLLECASGGTLFLDEVADMPQQLQGRLLRFLEEKTFRRLGAVADRTSNARVIASTNRDIEAAAESGALRPDLVYRLSVVVIDVPPLRERRPDIPLLVRHFVRSLAERLGSPVQDVSPQAMNLLVEHSWPGNVRELVNVLERAILLSESPVLDTRHFSIRLSKPTSLSYQLPPEGIDFRNLEREIVVQALRLARGNQTRAASLLGMTRDQIRYRMAKFGMNTQEVVGMYRAARDDLRAIPGGERKPRWDGNGARVMPPQTFAVDGVREPAEGHVESS